MNTQLSYGEADYSDYTDHTNSPKLDDKDQLQANILEMIILKKSVLALELKQKLKLVELEREFALDDYKSTYGERAYAALLKKICTD